LPGAECRLARRWPRSVALAVVVVLSIAGGAGAAVDRVVVESRLDVLGGKPFGTIGPYEKLAGTIHFTFDPASPANRRIVDLDKAPRNAAGRVEARADFMVLRPKALALPRVALIEVSNRGGKAALGYLNDGTYATDPTLAADFGDGLLMRLGLTVVWVGWQFDVPRTPGLLRLVAPVASEDGRPITGPVRSDWTVDRTVTTLPLAHRGHVPYLPTASRDADAALTVRDGRLAPRRIVPRGQWRFARDTDQGPVADREHVFMASGFQAGKIYELVYSSEGPAVVGLGLAAIRDVAAYVKHEREAVFPARATVALGISQTGRFLRHFLYQGFNTDEQGRQAFDGMLIHTAGAGRGSFNHRFAQPSRDGHRYSAFFFPTDLFPFAGRALRDPLTGATDGLLTHALAPAHRPKIFYTNTGYEYWGRAGSLVHTTPDAATDVEPLPEERVYHLAGAQHFVGGFPPPAGAGIEGTRAYLGNPLDFLPVLRALLVQMIAWVTEDVSPPPSACPRLDAGTLVPIDRLRFPAIPGVTAPAVAHEAYRVDYGPRWTDGVITIEPPRLGPAFPIRAPQVDSLGNEHGGVRTVELLAPLATYTPWSLRRGHPGGADELLDFLGTYIPLPRSEAERRALGDPRPSIEGLYGGRSDYLERAREAAASLVRARLLLPDDAPRVVERAGRHWDWLERK
jgi:hypothetical protein